MPEVYQLHILLREISPAIWRRVLVRSDSTITDLHYTIQILMGWSDYHLNKFRIHAKSYGVYHMGGMSFPDDPDEVLLSAFEFRLKERFLYEYDFNVDWMIDIRLEERRALEPSQSYPFCISGSRAGPPEECGGPIAFMAWEDEFSHSLVVSRMQDLCEDQVDEIELYLHEIDHAKWWLGKEEFDRKEINRRLNIYSKGDEEWYGAVFE